jgi:hypothetical protein
MPWQAMSARPIARHVIDTHFEPSDPRLLSLLSSYNGGVLEQYLRRSVGPKLRQRVRSVGHPSERLRGGVVQVESYVESVW